MINYAVIGQRVKFYRTKAKITQAQLAEQLDISVSYISQIERGNTEVSLKRLEEIASIINVKLEILITEVEPNYSVSEYEIIEIIRNWNPEQTKTLLKIIQNLDECFCN